MSVHTAKPGDIYLDKDGKPWTVTSRCDEPMVTAVRLYIQEEVHPHQAEVNSRQSGGVSGAMWTGWKKLEIKQ